ncbi:MAG: hypothetical protein ACFBSE_10375, partial [Prochloraceae cyanobacterium]
SDEIINTFSLNPLPLQNLAQFIEDIPLQASTFENNLSLFPELVPGLVSFFEDVSLNPQIQVDPEISSLQQQLSQNPQFNNIFTGPVAPPITPLTGTFEPIIA